MFRIVQECLTNIAKHAAASQVVVALAVSQNTLALTVADNGCAQQLPFKDNPGIGLLGIRERVDALGGELSSSIVNPSGLKGAVKLPNDRCHMTKQDIAILIGYTIIALVREGYRSLLEKQPNMVVVAEAVDGTGLYLLQGSTCEMWW